MRNLCVNLIVLIVLLAFSVLLLPVRLLAAPAAPPATQPSKEAAERAAGVMANLDTFTLSLDFNGDEDKPYYRLFLSVPKLPPIANDGTLKDEAFHQRLQITEAEAKKIVTQLTADGFFDHAMGDLRAGTPAAPAGPYYSLIVSSGAKGLKSSYEEWLPFDATLFQRLDGVRKVMEGDAAKAMDNLLDRLSGERTAIEKADKK